MAEDKPAGDKLEEFSNEANLRMIWRAMTGFAFLVALVTLYCVFHFGSNKPLLRTIAAIWFLGPPAWFIFENNFLLKPRDIEEKSKRMTRFRLGQDAAKMAWFGISALIVYFTKLS